MTGVDKSGTERQGIRIVEPSVEGLFIDRDDLLAAAWCIVGSRFEAEEIVQDAYADAVARWDHVSTLDEPAAWLRRAVVNRSISVLRRRTSGRNAIARLVSRLRLVEEAEVPRSSQWIWSLVRELPQRQTEAVVLFYVFDLSLDQAAATMGISKSALSTHLMRARSSLSERISTGDFG